MYLDHIKENKTGIMLANDRIIINNMHQVT